MPNNARGVEVGAERFVGDVLELGRRDPERAVDAFRMGELVAPRGPFSRAWINRRLRDGDLQAIRVGSVVLVTGASLRGLLASAETWEPTK